MSAKILVVDDSLTARKMISGMLSEYNVLTACDGKDALRSIDDNPDIDLVILDLNMPVMDGFEVLRIMKSDARYARIRAIILTNYDEIDNEIKGLNLGAIDYIRKPVNIESLLIRIGIHLKLKQAQELLEQENILLDQAVREKTAAVQQMFEKTRNSEILFRSIFNQAPIGIAFVSESRFISHNRDNIPCINPMFEKITGRSKEELHEMTWAEITHPDDLSEDLDHFRRFKSGMIDSYTMQKRFIKPDGSVIWVNMIVAPLNLTGASGYHLCLINDITERKAVEAALSESERSKKTLLANLPGMAFRCSCDRHWTVEYVSDGCYELTGYDAETILKKRSRFFHDLILPDYLEPIHKESLRLLELHTPLRYEFEIRTASGRIKWVLGAEQGVYDEHGNPEAVEGILIDITAQREQEKMIQHINYHDFLTGLFNRRYFEDSLRKYCHAEYLPLSIVLVNINGIRLINDALGFSEGDRMIIDASGILRSCCREFDVLARTGGDEFGLLLPNTDNETAEKMRDSIAEACTAFNRQRTDKLYTISLSSGMATQDHPEQDVTEILRAADEFLRNSKLLNRKSIRSGLISSILTTVYEKSQETEEHAKRISEMSKMIGQKLNLSPNRIGELELFAMLHDIGKVAIDDRILKKPGKLDDDEWIIMKTHSEIGFRIASSATELDHIADYILTHHERWDGKGYPQGLAGEAIPLLSRIVAIADSYDAMTNNRVYRKAMSAKEAVEEIKRNNGTQFDPHIVEIFLNIIDTYLAKQADHKSEAADPESETIPE